MAFLRLFKSVKNQQFSYKPRFWDPKKEEAEKSMWDVLVAAPTDALDMIMDPNKKEREEEEKLRKEAKASKKQ